MTLLHVHFHLRNLQALQRLLDGQDRSSNAGSGSAAMTGGSSSSAGRSWKGASAVKTAMAASEVNALDWLGRSVLHLACTIPNGVEYVRAILKHPGVNVNLVDTESHWTALHRALYHGNIAAALLLLQRPDMDISLKDSDGYTAFDLYNSTVNGTTPEPALHSELYTWGANRNAALGLVDSNDRTFPDQVVIPKEASAPVPASTARFSHLSARQIQMSKLHTVVVTSESKANVRICGFGSGGRLGPSQHTQYSLISIPQLTQSIVSVALGQDHTLALTSNGEVLSWGLSRFHQLGYAVEPSANSKLEEPIQSTPRKIFGPLKKEIVKGVAASKQCSACWTATEVFTWGTNNGQLGYDKAAQPYQVQPRKVSKVVRPVVSIALTDHAMACLLDTQEVFCVWNDRYMKIAFPMHAFPHDFRPYRPPQAIKDAHIVKITSGDDMFAALSSNGEVFTFAVPEAHDGESNRQVFKPQRVWALRRQFSAVRDVALGADGSIIICTASGHVFVRSRQGNKQFKFQRVPYLQRATQVCGNSTGAFGALRADFKPVPIRIEGNTIANDLTNIRPFLLGSQANNRPRWSFIGDEAEEVEDSDIEADFYRLWDLTRATKKGAVFDQTHGADIRVHVKDRSFPAHSAILAARSPVLCSTFAGTTFRDGDSKVALSGSSAKLDVRGCSPLTVLIFLDYLYSDELLAIWDRRLAFALQNELTVNPATVRAELQALARLANLPSLGTALDSPAKRVPQATMVRDMRHLFRDLPAAADTILLLADRDVRCHSAILRARCPVFESFFGQEDWTRNRRKADGTVEVNLKHLRWNVMDYVFQFMCCGGDSEIFENLEFAKSVDEVIEFMFDVMAAANELLLDRLLLLCSSAILKWVDINNVCYILTDASHFHAQQLVESVQGYMVANLETLLESRILSDLTPALIKQLSVFLVRHQEQKSPTVRRNVLAIGALEKHADWLAIQDFPEPIIPSTKRKTPSSPELLAKRRSSKTTLTTTCPTVAAAAIDDIFEMDNDEIVLPPPAVSETVSATPVWKPSHAPRVDMKALMAEAAASRRTTPDSVLRSKPAAPRMKAADPGPSSKSGASTPWRVPAPAKPLSGSPPATTSPPITPSTSLGRDFPPPSPSTPPRPRASLSIPPSASPLGPVFTPSRQPAARPNNGSPTVRRVSSGNTGKAWQPAPILASALPSASAGASFVAIQQLQLEQEQGASKDKRSLREIQAEEKAAREEVEFLRWWAEEEARVKAEQEALLAKAQSKVSAPSSSSSHNRGSKRGKKPREKNARAMLSSPS
ncbi:unnamed protein product [Mycena citricolor]|uniref:BTB domain-containing protein n=1 Tax=Mycena citricolor TaxID=2018698 RepID=A0AAD2GWG7_9AGAR|nr:unnamed protein product [Mycena citricolor]